VLKASQRTLQVVVQVCNVGPPLAWDKNGTHVTCEGQILAPQEVEGCSLPMECDADAFGGEILRLQKREGRKEARRRKGVRKRGKKSEEKKRRESREKRRAETSEQRARITLCQGDTAQPVSLTPTR
jgi:hypothetical protein